MKFHSKILISNILYTRLSAHPERAQQPFWGLIRLLSFCQPYSFSTDSKISVTVCSVTKLICSHSGSNQLLTRGEKNAYRQAVDWQRENHLKPPPRTRAKSDPWQTHFSHISNKSSRASPQDSLEHKRESNTHTMQRNTMIIIRYKACLAPIYHPVACLFLKLKNATLATIPLIGKIRLCAPNGNVAPLNISSKVFYLLKTGMRFTFLIKYQLKGSSPIL